MIFVQAFFVSTSTSRCPLPSLMLMHSRNEHLGDISLQASHSSSNSYWSKSLNDNLLYEILVSPASIHTYNDVAFESAVAMGYK
jgi:hypothetical protein